MRDFDAMILHSLVVWLQMRWNDVEDAMYALVCHFNVLQEWLCGKRDAGFEAVSTSSSTDEEAGTHTYIRNDGGRVSTGGHGGNLSRTYDEALEAHRAAEALKKLRELSPTGRQPSARNAWRQSPDNATREAAKASHVTPPNPKETSRTGHSHKRNASRVQSVAVWVQSPSKGTNSAAIDACARQTETSKNE